ncbi:MAG: DUF3667 domain-containing protein, partial [Bacteroidota bacterium]
MKCVSCGHDHNEKFCPECGEKAGVDRITLTSIFSSALGTVTTMDKGFLFNVKSLLLRPHQFVQAYIRGKRKGVLNPVSFLIFSTTIYLIVETLTNKVRGPGVLNDFSDEYKANLLFRLGHFIRANTKYFWIFSIVPLSNGLKLLFPKYNYPEHLAISSFIIAQSAIAGLISYFLFRFPLFFDPITFGMILWLSFKIYFQRNIVESVLLSAAALVL